VKFPSIEKHFSEAIQNDVWFNLLTHRRHVCPIK